MIKIYYSHVVNLVYLITLFLRDVCQSHIQPFFSESVVLMIITPGEVVPSVAMVKKVTHFNGVYEVLHEKLVSSSTPLFLILKEYYFIEVSYD